MSVTLFVDSGSGKNFTASQVDLAAAVYTKATVTKGTWIFYKYQNYNDGHAETSKTDYKIVDKKDPKVDISSVNASMYLLPDAEEGVVLFHYNNYAGNQPAHCIADTADVATLFPTGTVESISSAIVLSNNQKWMIYPKVDFGGPISSILYPGKWYACPTDMGFPNDKVYSIRKA